MNLRLDILFTDLSQHFKIDLVVLALEFFIHEYRCKRWRSHLCPEIKSNRYNHNPNIKPDILKNLIRKRLLKDIH